MSTTGTIDWTAEHERFERVALPFAVRAARRAFRGWHERKRADAEAEFLAKMKGSKEGDRTLLDRTATLLASNMGNASAHTCDNLPVLLAGGEFEHAGHVAFDRKDNKPLSNLFVRVLRQMGLDFDRFGSSTGVLTEV